MQYSLVIKVLKILKRLKLAIVRTVVEIFKLSTARKLFSSIHYKLQLSLIGLTHNWGEIFSKVLFTHTYLFWVCFLSKNIGWIKTFDKIQNSGLIFSDLVGWSKNTNDTWEKKYLIVIHLNYFSHGIYNPFLKYSGLY